MKIVLRQDVLKLGEAGTVQEVANGYARNFLIPQGMAVVATSGELKTAAHNQAVKDRKIVKQEQAMQTVADKIDGQRLEFTARAGSGGRLYGSVTAGDVAERLTAVIGEEVDRRRVILEDPIRTMGEHRVTVHLVGRLRPQVTVIVLGEQDETEGALATEEIDAAGDSGTAPDATTNERAEQHPTPGASGHPEPGSGHDDSKTETVDQGPPRPEVDGVPGASGDIERRGGAVAEVAEDGPAVEVEDEMDGDR